MHKIIGAVLLAAACGAANAQLQARDINGDGGADAYYDPWQDITWLADAHYALTSGYVFPPNYLGYQTEPGTNDLPSYNTWAAQLDVFGVTGWRLPLAYTEPCDAGCPNLVRLETEITRLFGNVGSDSPFINTGGLFWTSNSYTTPGGWIWYQLSEWGGSGRVTSEPMVPTGWGWAVHDGDIGGAISPVPEPSTYALMLAGLAAVGLSRRKRG